MAVWQKTIRLLLFTGSKSQAQKIFSTFIHQTLHFICQTFRKIRKIMKNLLLDLIFKRQLTTQEQINELFSKYGKTVNFKWISKENNKMALIELSSLEESVLALIVIHIF